MSYYGSQAFETDERWTAVDNYSFPILHPASAVPSNNALEHALDNSAKNGLPGIAVPPSQGKFLMLQAQLIHAKNILEIGTLGGYSTIWMASARPDIHVTTIEINEHHAAVARDNLAKAGLSERVDVLLGSGLEVLPKLKAEVEAGTREKFNLVFIDADKENNWAYVDAAVGMCEAGACVIVDNVVRKGMLADADTNDSRVHGARKVVEEVGKDERLDGIVMQTVGEKNYDGFLMAIVKKATMRDTSD
ncbi:O-methyltransferas-like protein family 3 [Lepidopterella palustris CBS 459.81]|uniref:O-methyltransferas-like protein family 3 n=1 Tax=Lepidopterella palustris CBS 459.81 TaxID=1314670 RepID=A0A8E2EF87_9PEZI|nr:O-methyltransferas-like protein family 3 [Lepidopterella palustris CBS 459.81]